MGISPATVSSHWANIRAKTGTVSRGQAIARSLGQIARENQRELELFATLVDTLEDYAIFMMDRNRIVKSWNPGVERFLGFTEEEWIGQLGDEIFTPEDRAQGAPLQEQSLAETKGKAMDERWHLRKDGTRFFGMGVLVPIRDADGRILCLSKILRDLTRLKRLEERVRELGGNPDAV